MLGVSSFRVARGRLTDAGRNLCPALTLSLLGAMLKGRPTAHRPGLCAAAGLQSPEILRARLAHLLAIVEVGTLSPVLDRVYTSLETRAMAAQLTSTSLW
jgi:hypothetical protein